MAKQTVLIVDDETSQRRITETVAARAGYATLEAGHGEAALDLLTGAHGKSIDAVILDYNMPGKTGIEVLRELRPQFPQLPVIMLTAHSSVSTAVEAMRAGASDFLLKPASPDRITRALASALDHKSPGGELRPLTEKLPDSLGFAEIVGSDAGFRAALAVAEKAAQKNVPILVEGESGVGKEVVAQAVHAASPRKDKPLVIVNCGAIPANLVESVLFGHEKGAFTGAVEKHVGRFGEADGGTLFLDEIGELPLDAQVKLLRALQTGQIEPVGAKGHVTVDVRLIAATNRNLAEEVREGRFREDLFYRLNIFPLHLPALADRREDIPMLVAHFLKQAGAKLRFDAPALRALCQHGWPGNIRELRNVVERAVVLFGEGEIGVGDVELLLGAALDRRALPNEDAALWEATTVSEEEADTRLPEAAVVPLRPYGNSLDMDPRALLGAGSCDMRALVAKLEQSLIHAALEQSGDIVADAARVLGLQRTSLIEKMRKYQIGRGERAVA
ncbi:MAG: sigma-54-dependent Fis family transcriptional regulator [Sphingomonadaceae bacterium]|nr:sigma-54-dependent Fis family transcriptional regulator [Sphingomonadaceae bacterium]